PGEPCDGKFSFVATPTQATAIWVWPGNRLVLSQASTPVVYIPSQNAGAIVDYMWTDCNGTQQVLQQGYRQDSKNFSGWQKIGSSFQAGTCIAQVLIRSNEVHTDFMSEDALGWLPG